MMVFTQETSRWSLESDGVSTYFHLLDDRVLMAEEYYFHLMGSMRKLRMNIPLAWTLEYINELTMDFARQQNLSTGTIRFTAYRTHHTESLYRSPVFINMIAVPGTQGHPVCLPHGGIELDVLKDITVNQSLLSELFTPQPENIYAQAYAEDHGLDDVLLLNGAKRIARTRLGNLLLLKDNVLTLPKTSEGAYISPLAENFITYIHRQNLCEILPAEIAPFTTQQSSEMVVFSDEHGIFPVEKIRNKTFGFDTLGGWVTRWAAHLTSQSAV